MRPFLFVPICFVSLVVPVAVLAGGADGFDGVVRTIETKYHVQATRIPFLGLASLISRKATNGGVSNMHVAEFEDFHANMDGEELNQLVVSKLGPGWERVIRETSRNGRSQTLIFMRPENNRMGLFVLDADGDDMNVVQVSVDPEHLAENIGHYSHFQNDDKDSDE